MKFLMTPEQGDRVSRAVEGNALGRFFSSHAMLALFYGIYLLLYELPILHVLLEPVHPLLMAWTAALTLYDVLVRRLWEKLPLWQWLLAFAVLALVSALVNHAVGLLNNVKIWVLTCLPLAAFLPLCLTTEKQEKAVLTALSGAAVVASVASLIAIVMYLLRISAYVTFLGATKFVGYCYYIPGDPNSGILLYGLYADTNQASTYAIVFAAYSVMLLSGCRRGLFGRWKGWVKGFAIASLVIQLCYFPLANSRGGWLCLAVACLLGVFFYAFCTRLKTEGKAKRVALSLLAAMVSVAVLCGGLLLVRSGLSVVSKAILYEPSLHPEGGILGVGTPVHPDIPPETTGIPEADVFQKADLQLGAGRVAIWKEALELYTRFPVFGVGASNAHRYAHLLEDSQKLSVGYSLHNSFLEVLVGCGALGFVALMGFLGTCGWLILRKLFCDGRQLRANDHLSIFGCIFLAGASLFLNGLFINITAMYFLFLCLFSFALSRCRAKDVKK